MTDPTPSTPAVEATTDRPGTRLGRGSAGPTSRPGPFRRSSYAPAINRGYGEAMGRGLELALTLGVMSGLGWVLDRIAGTYPVFTLVLSVLGFVGISIKLWLGYDLEMRKLDQDAVWSRGTGVEPAVPASSPTDDPEAAADASPEASGRRPGRAA